MHHLSLISAFTPFELFGHCFVAMMKSTSFKNVNRVEKGTDDTFNLDLIDAEQAAALTNKIIKVIAGIKGMRETFDTWIYYCYNYMEGRGKKDSLPLVLGRKAPMCMVPS
ncbi:hypothetical protein ACH5RR_008534 [Cinchona calisaya]|uniref:Uncharacterized protein n=1 Tax=Cinchona calisaya TaxID=153742 RepID=A0ABD3ABX0_9GENT